MKAFTLFVVLLLGAGLLWSSARAVSQGQPEKKAGLSAEQLAHAKALFGNKCARCHGPDGRGQTVLGDMLGVPDFTDAQWWKDRDNDEGLIKSITNGNGDMPAFGKKLTKSEISLLAAYVRHFNKTEHQVNRVAKLPWQPGI